MERADRVAAPRSQWVHLFGTAFLYFLAGKFALLLAVPPGYASPIWPAAGFALACILLFGNRVWPGIVIGHFLVNVGTSMDVSTVDASVKSVLIPVGIGIGGAAQAMLGAYLIRRFVGWPNPLINEREIIRFFLLGGPVACLVSSTIGVGILIIAGIVTPEKIPFNWFVWWFGDTLGALLAPSLLLVWFAKPEELWARRRKLLFLPLFGAMVAAIILYLNITHTERSRIDTEFKNSSILLSDAVKTNLHTTVDVGETVADFMQHSKDVGREEFRSFVNPLLARYPYIKAISWDPRVLDADRRKHEDAAKKDGFSQYGIREKTADGNWKKAPLRADYVPVHYLEPYTGNEQALGYNLASDPKRQVALGRASETGKSAVSERIQLVQDVNGPHGVLLLHPVFGLGENGKTIKGFITVVMYVGENMKAALKDANLENFKVTLEDQSASEGERVLARFNGTLWTDTAETGKIGKETDSGISYHASFTMAGRTWAIRISPTAKYLNAHYSWPSWTSLAIGMLFCGLLAIFLLSVTGKSTVLERRVEEGIREVKDLYNLAPCGYHSLDRNGVFVRINDTELQWLGYTREEIIGKKKATDLMTEESREIFRRNFPIFLATGEVHDLEFEWVRKDGSVFNIILNGTAIRNEKGEIVQTRSTIFDITGRKKAEEALQSINWLLKEGSGGDDTLSNGKEYEPDYGDLTALNTDGEILNSVDKDTLYNIVNTYLDLLGTSSAIYEKNGDYAIGLFSSSWCRFMDSASRKQCAVDDNRSALAQGKWLCHESCWSDASKVSIRDTKPVDIECHGGIRLYAVPIYAGTEAIGSINFGYGNPPTDPKELNKIAERYSIDIAEIARLAKEYKARPPFLVELAKRRLRDSANLIGVLVERKRAEKAVKESEARFRLLVESSPFCIHEIGLDRCLLSMNRAGLDMLGLKEEKDVTGKAYLDSVSQRDKERVGALLQQALKGMPSQFEFISGGAASRQFSSCFVPLRNVAGGVEKLMGITEDITERRRAEESIKESEARYRQLSEASFEGIVITVDGKFVDANGAFARMFGYTPNEIIGMTPLDLASPESSAIVMEHLNKGIEGPPYEANGVKKDGSTFPVELQGRNILYQGQNARITAIRDISQRVKAEQAIRESEEKYRELVEGTSDWVWELNESGAFTYSSPQALGVTGYRPEEFLGKTPFDYMRTEDALRVAEFFRATVATQKPFKSYENSTLHKDGHDVIIETSGVPYYNLEGKFMGYRGINRDITERKKVQQALRDHENHLLQAQRVGGFGSYIYDIKANHWTSSEMLDEIFGIGTDFDRSAAGWIGFIHPDDRDVMQKALLACIEGKKDFDQEYRIIRPIDGNERWLHGLGKAECGADGRPLRIVGTNTDITARKRAEGEMLKAKEEAEKATLLKDKYVSLVSHDLKNPLGTIMGFLKMIHQDMEGKGDQRTMRLTDAALESAGQMQRLINEVLSISRIKSGAIQPNLKFFDGFMLGVKTGALLGPEAAKKGITLVNAIPQGTRLYTDEPLLGEVVNNLISNAIKFSKPGDTITMFVPDNEAATIAVKDTGVGIRSDLIPKLFKYEEKTSTPGTAGEQGSGLGLPLSRDIMMTLGGSLDVESEQGTGSTFYARLPRVRPKILIVDDDRNDRMLLGGYLSGLDVTVLEAEDGRDALRVIGESTPHLLVVDIVMPNMDGFELLEEVRKNPATSFTPFIMIAIQKNMEVNDKSLRLGANDFINKPISMEEFIPRVRRFIG